MLFDYLYYHSCMYETSDRGSCIFQFAYYFGDLVTVRHIARAHDYTNALFFQGPCSSFG